MKTSPTSHGKCRPARGVVRNRLAGLAAACALALLSLAASLAPARAAEGQLPILFDSRERIAKPDLSHVPRLRFLTTVDFPPFNFIDEGGRLSGFHVDLVREICRELQVEAKCQIQAVPFDELTVALDSGEGEAVAAGLRVTAELRERFLVSRPFLKQPARFLANRKAVMSGRDAAALSRARLGVIERTAHAAMLKSWFPAARPKTFADRKALLAALGKGEIDAAFDDGMALAFWSAGPEARDCCTLVPGAYVSEKFLGEGLTLLSGRDRPEIGQAIDHALLALSRNGRLQELYFRYFPFGLF